MQDRSIPLCAQDAGSLQLQLEDRPEPVLTSTVHSLYARNQVQRILGAAGFRAEDEHDADDSASGDSVELF